jgi:mycothiol synthase
MNGMEVLMMIDIDLIDESVDRKDKVNDVRRGKMVQSMIVDMKSNVSLDLPEGYVMRPATIGDLKEAVEMFNAASRALIGVDEFTYEEYLPEWRTPGFNLETDTRLVLTGEGKIVGCYELWDVNDPPVRLYCWGRVHPDYKGLGIGSNLLAWAEERAGETILRAPEGTRVVLHTHARSLDKEANELFKTFGYRMIRQSWRMVIELNDQPPRAQWPAGIKVRTIKVGQEEIPILQAVREAFRDHWGHVENPFEEDLERWMHWINSDIDFDPTLWFLAMDGDEIAGVSLCRPKISDDPEMGWVDTLGVRRPWRKRGLGLALLHHSFGEFYQRGTKKAGLGVDAQSLTGATRLYRRAGMHLDAKHQHDLYEKELRSGIDLTTQSVEE